MRDLMLGEYAYARQSGRKQGLVATTMVVTMESFYDAMAEAGPLPPDAYGKRIDEEMAKHPINPWVKILAPSLKRAREPIALFEEKSAMLNAAMDVALDGEAAVEKSKDPFGDGAFGYRKRDGAFVLKSVLKYQDAPVELVVGL
jgi:hypothetical protein